MCLLGTLCLSLCGATCENQDYYLPQRLTLDGAAPLEPVVVEISQPYRGLNSIDMAIRNTGSTAGEFGVAAGVCFECTLDTDCGSEQDIATLDLRCTTERGFCTTGEALDPCNLPSTVGPVGLEPGEEGAFRFSENDLGLGDHLHVEFMCLPEGDGGGGEPCSGVLDFVVLLRQVECRVDTECDSNQVCDSQMGFCRAEVVTEDTGCRVISQPKRPSGILTVVLGLLLGWRILSGGVIFAWVGGWWRSSRSRRRLRSKPRRGDEG